METEVTTSSHTNRPVPTGDTPFWSVEVSTLYHNFNSGPDGLPSGEAAKRLARYGRNELVSKPHLSTFRLFLKQYKSPLLIVLIAAALISALMYDWTEALIILVIVFTSTVISFRQEHTARKAVEKLKAIISIKSTVLRDGRPVEIPAAELVPGDVVLLSAGSLVPADGRIIESTDLFVTESALTGESFPAEKRAGVVDPDSPVQQIFNSVFMGTSVRSGTAQILLTGTGSQSRFARIAGRLEQQAPENEFERGIHQFSYLLTRIVLILVVLVFAINIIDEKSTFESLLFAIALAVGMTPELLPAIITITLSHGARQMADKGMIVKKLNAIETFGSMDVFCSDKTGTLTEGVITLSQAVDSRGNNDPGVEQLACLNAYFQQGLNNPLDEALLKRTREAGYHFSEFRKTGEIPYDFIRKRLTVAIEGEHIAGTYLITKGAFNQVLTICNAIQNNGESALLSQEGRQALAQQYKTWSKQGYRVLGVAQKILNSHPASLSKDVEQDFTFCGFLLFYDAPKEGVKEVLEGLKKLGIQLKIITGDNRYVTRHVARQVGIASKKIITSEELQQIREEALIQQVQQVHIFAELDPQQKERIIRALKNAGYVVGYLGDGINDATALFESDVGISVDSAVDVAKDSADLVLSKHDLEVLRDTIREGRITFANTLKYILTTSSANFGNMISMAAASVFLPFLPMLAKQILLNNFLSDVPGISLAGDRVDEQQILHPQKWSMPFIQNFMITFGLVSTLFDFLIFGLLVWVFNATAEEFRTAWFIESLVSEVLIIFVIRTPKRFYASLPQTMLVVNALAVLLIAFALPYLPLSEITGFVPLSITFIGMITGVSILYMLTTEALKTLFYTRLNRHKPRWAIGRKLEFESKIMSRKE